MYKGCDVFFSGNVLDVSGLECPIHHYWIAHDIPKRRAIMAARSQAEEFIGDGSDALLVNAKLVAKSSAWLITIVFVDQNLRFKNNNNSNEKKKPATHIRPEYLQLPWRSNSWTVSISGSVVSIRYDRLFGVTFPIDYIDLLLEGEMLWEHWPPKSVDYLQPEAAAFATKLCALLEAKGLSVECGLLNPNNRSVSQTNPSFRMSGSKFGFAVPVPALLSISMSVAVLVISFSHSNSLAEEIGILQAYQHDLVRRVVGPSEPVYSPVAQVRSALSRLRIESDAAPNSVSFSELVVALSDPVDVSEISLRRIERIPGKAVSVVVRAPSFRQLEAFSDALAAKSAIVPRLVLSETENGSVVGEFSLESG